MERRREVQKEVKTAVSGTHIEIFAVYGIGQQQYREKRRVEICWSIPERGVGEECLGSGSGGMLFCPCRCRLAHQQTPFQMVIALRTEHIGNGVREEQNSGEKISSFQYRGAALRLCIDSMPCK